MSTREPEPSEALFRSLAEELLADPSVTRGTMMGQPCLRANAAYFASLDPATGYLVVKLPADRVSELIASRHAIPFAPAGRAFREWAACPHPDPVHWSALLREARAFASSTLDGSRTRHDRSSR